MIVWQGNPTRDSIRICVRPDADGPVTFAISGISYGSVTSTQSTLDGVVVRTISGLQPDTVYPVTVVQSDLQSEVIYARTDPGNDAIFQIGWVSCYWNDQDAWWEDIWSRKCSDLRRRLLLGDTGYAGAVDAWHVNARTRNTLANSADSSVGYEKARQSMLMPKLRAANKRVPVLVMVDDHWYPGDNFDFSVTQLNLPVDLGATTQAQVDAAFLAHDLSAQAYLMGNPDNTSPLAVKQKAPTSNLLDAQFPIKYFDCRVGSVHLVVNDHITGRSNVAATDDASKYLMSPAQEAWTLDVLMNSTAPFKIWASPKNLIGIHPMNQDGWRSYRNQRDRMLAQILPNVTGLICITGDNHSPHSALIRPDHGLGNGYLYEMCPAPGSGPNTQAQVSADGYRDQSHDEIFRYRCCGNLGSDTDLVYDGCGVVHVQGDEYMEAVCYDRRGAARFRSGRIYPGSNLPVGRRPTITRRIR